MPSVRESTQLKSGQLARQTGINPQTIRYYERVGLLPRPRRLPSGYRVFSTDDVRRVRFIKRAQALGFALTEIKALLALDRQPRGDCADVGRLVQHQIEAIDSRIEHLGKIREALARLADACVHRVRATDDCPILESLNEEAPSTASHVRRSSISQPDPTNKEGE